MLNDTMPWDNEQWTRKGARRRPCSLPPLCSWCRGRWFIRGNKVIAKTLPGPFIFGWAPPGSPLTSPTPHSHPLVQMTLLSHPLTVHTGPTAVTAAPSLALHLPPTGTDGLPGASGPPRDGGAGPQPTRLIIRDSVTRNVRLHTVSLVLW